MTRLHDGEAGVATGEPEGESADETADDGASARAGEEAGEGAGDDSGEPPGWTWADAERLYGLPHWGDGQYRVSESGTVVVVPSGRGGEGAWPDASAPRIDVAEVIEGLRERGLSTPVLLRFPDVLRTRMERLRGAFDRAMAEEGYAGGYACVYPIKVNQQRHWAEQVRDFARPLGFGFEAGSKSELLAVVALTEACGDMPIVCNGFKDDEYIETVILAHKLGRHITPVVESFAELGRILRHAAAYGVRPRIGVRVKPSAVGAGRWAESGGERSKFGLHATELMAALELLKSHGMADCLKMVHCHAGSQICDIRRVKSTVTELARVYCELRRLGAGLDTIDVGGGLAVDYDGSNSDWANSANYGLDEYASDVIYRIRSVCDDAGQPHPRVLTESGRALAASSSVLVFDVLGRTEFSADPGLGAIAEAVEAERETLEGGRAPRPVRDLLSAWEQLIEAGSGDEPDARAMAEAYHDAEQARGEALSLFELGYLSLPMRAAAEKLFWAIARRVLRAAEGDGEAMLPQLADAVPDLARRLSDIYFCNFSLFQSLPDSWAIDQIFPVMPIRRLGERPTRRAILADITCDSDGQIDRYGSPEMTPEFKRAVELHDLALHEDGSPAEPYDVAVFLVGAYQEVLGDLHNLFGDTHAVHVTLDEEAGWRIDEVVEGDTVREVLGYVQYDADQLKNAVRREVERAVRGGRMAVAESRSLMRFYEGGLEGYTYLE